MKSTVTRIFNSVFFAALCLLLVQCAATTAPAPPLPKDIFGVSVGQEKDAAEKRLKEIAKLIRIEEKKQEVWALKDDARFSHLAIGYDGEDRIRYVTAYTKPSGGAPIKADEIGDLSKAKRETVGPNYTYIWQSGDGGEDAYQVTVRGNQPDKFAFYTLSSTVARDSEEEEEERAERGESEDQNKRAVKEEEEERERKSEKRETREKEEKEKTEKDRDAKEK